MCVEYVYSVYIYIYIYMYIYIYIYMYIYIAMVVAKPETQPIKHFPRAGAVVCSRQ